MSFIKIIITIFIALLLSSCSTSLTIKSNPTGANVVLKGTGITAITDQKIKIPNNLFDTAIDEYILYTTSNQYKAVNVNTKNKVLNQGINADKSDYKLDDEGIDVRKRITGSKRQEVLVFEKEGYRTVEKVTELEKGEANTITVELEEVNTQLNISSTPAPTHLKFITLNPNYKIEDLLPSDWPEEFTTPINLSCTENEVKYLKNVSLKKTFGDGYIPTGMYRDLGRKGLPLKLKEKKANNLNISLKPVVTTLQVMSTPPGATVEDISSGGFGYLGETPLIRNFNWEDVVEWSERREYKSTEEEANAYQNNARTGPEMEEFYTGKEYKFKNIKLTTIKRDQKFANNKRLRLEKGLIYLDLRITKPGYEDAYLKRLRLPVGEERSFHKNLNGEITNINFASDPAGVHVYVTRSTNKDIYDATTGTVTNQAISYKKHLGTTPFTLNMDPTDPLIHGDKFILMKTGYITVDDLQYAYGNTSYYMVMEPKNIKKR